MLTLTVVFGAAIIASLVLTPLAVNAAHQWRLYDDPSEHRRIHDTPIPRLGGVSVFCAMALTLLAAAGGLIPLAYFEEPPRVLLGVLAGGGIVFLAGLWDDIRGLTPVMKFAAQCAAAAVAYALGFRIEVLGFGHAEFLLGSLSFPLTLLWVVGVTNAFNLIDGLDGLATGVAIVALGTVLAVASALGNVDVALVSVALLGALIGFLRYNFNPARIFLGDSGSLFVGYMLAVLSVYGSMKSATAVLVIVPLFALALPLADTALAIARRWLRGAPLSGADARHIHHRLLAAGHSHRAAVVVMYLVALGLAMLGLAIAFAPPTAVLGIAIAGGVATVVLLLVGMRHLQYHEFIEAGAVLSPGLLRVRRIIQDQIHARDLSDVIGRAGSAEQLDSILDSSAAMFGFLGMELCRESSVCRQRIAISEEQLERAWKLDFPVLPRRSPRDDPYVLRIWCSRENGVRPFGAERVAGILAPTLEEWLRRDHLPARSPARQRQLVAEGQLAPQVAAASIADPALDAPLPSRALELAPALVNGSARRMTEGP